MGFQCEEEVREPDFAFSTALKLSPYKKIYSINDTITVELTTNNKQLLDRLSNSLIPLDTTQLAINIFGIKRFPVPSLPEMLCDIQVENITNSTFDTSTLGNNRLYFLTGCLSPTFNFRAKFIPKKTGIFSIELGSQIEYCPGKIKSLFASSRFTFDLADCNKDIWLAIPASARERETGYTDVRIDKKEIFIFKVE